VNGFFLQKNLFPAMQFRVVANSTNLDRTIKGMRKTPQTL
jgi:hypothetical protein